MEYFDAEGNLVDPFDEADDGPKATLPRKVVRRLEADSKRARELETENEQLKRERAFVQAGIPLEDKRAAYFIAGYHGEQTPEAIRQEWNESFGGTSSNVSQVSQELDAMHGAEALVMGGGALTPNLLAQRDAELSALSQSDPRYTQKFDAIFAKYGGRSGSLTG